jgi:mxaJ protein
MTVLRRRAHRVLSAASLIAALLLSSLPAHSSATQRHALAALPLAPTPSQRLAFGFAHVVQRAKDAVAVADYASAKRHCEAARRLAIVLDATAPVPGAIQRREWVEAVRDALIRADLEEARNLLASADERALSRWPAPAFDASLSADAELRNAVVIDATGTVIGEIERVETGRVTLRPAASQALNTQQMFFGGKTEQARAIAAAPTLNPRALRVCADPNNLPFSDANGTGFQNALARLLARELHAELQYTWWPERRGFLRNTLHARRCDIVLGLPVGYARVLTTHPLYTSSYTWVHHTETLHNPSIAAAELRALRIGVPLVGDDGANPPVVNALVRGGLVENLHGYPVYGDYREERPTGELVHAVARGDVDVAVVWGPIAGYNAARERPALEVTPVTSPTESFTFDIAIAVRAEDTSLRDELDAVLERRRSDVDAILDRFHVPRGVKRGSGIK